MSLTAGVRREGSGQQRRGHLRHLAHVARALRQRAPGQAAQRSVHIAFVETYLFIACGKAHI